VRTSLYAKIIPWFFVSLIVLASVFLFLFKIDFRLQSGSPFAEPGGDRMINFAWQISSELSQSPPEDWDAVLEGFSATHGVTWHVFNRWGEQLAGPTITLPESVKEKVLRPSGRPRGGHHRPPPPGGMRPEGLSQPPPPPHDAPPKPSEPRFSAHSDDPSLYWIGVNAPISLGPGPPRAVTFLAASDSITGNGLFWNPLPWILALALFVLLGVLLWIPIIRTITRPIGRITKATEDMSRGRFNVQLNDRRSDEIGSLAASINEMASRLNGYLTGQRRFLADISHELSSPIARAKLALSIAEPETDGKAQKRIRTALGELENMSDLVNKLLALTRTEVGPQKIRLVPVRIHDIVTAAVEAEAPPDADINIDINLETAALADPELLSRAMVNLVRNAVNYAVNAGPITVSAHPDVDSIVIDVQDQGPGVPAMELDYIFEPFYRAEESRSRKTGGVGLGLAVVKSCVQACKGTVTASNLEPAGFSVRITLQRSNGMP